MTNATSSRPDRGLSPEEALERWSDPQAYAAMRECWEHRQGKLIRRGRKTENEPNHQEYLNRREPLELALLEKLRSRQLVASGIPRKPDGRGERVVIHSSYFRKGWIRFDIEEVGGNGPGYERPEIFSPDAIPDNIETIPHWLAELAAVEPTTARAPGPETDAAPPVSSGSGSTFSYSTNYRRVELNGVVFLLSFTQAQIVRRLHKAYQEKSPWVSTEELRKAVGFASGKIAQVFRRHKNPHWSVLIESDGRGLYRLRLDDWPKE